MKRMNFKILRISQVRYKAQERYQERSKYSTQGVHNMRGVAIILDQDKQKQSKGIGHCQIVFLLKIAAKPLDPSIIQMYTPKSFDLNIIQIYTPKSLDLSIIQIYTPRPLDLSISNIHTKIIGS